MFLTVAKTAPQKSAFVGSASATGTAAVLSVAVCFRRASPFLTGRPTRLPVKIATVGVVTAQTRPPCVEGWRAAAEGASTRRPRQRVGVTVQLASSDTSKDWFGHWRVEAIQRRHFGVTDATGVPRLRHFMVHASPCILDNYSIFLIRGGKGS